MKVWEVKYGYGDDHDASEGLYADRDDAFKAYAERVVAMNRRSSITVTPVDYAPGKDLHHNEGSDWVSLVDHTVIPKGGK